MPATLTADSSVRWQLRPTAPPSALKDLCRDLKIPPLLASILWSRGLGVEAAKHLSPPFTVNANT